MTQLLKIENIKSFMVLQHKDQLAQPRNLLLRHHLDNQII